MNITIKALARELWRHGELCGKLDRILSELKHLTSSLERYLAPMVIFEPLPLYSPGSLAIRVPIYSLTQLEKDMSRKDWRENA